MAICPFSLLRYSRLVEFTPTLQARLLGVRSQLWQEVTGYLRALEAYTAQLPSYFPKHTGFAGFRQKLQLLSHSLDPNERRAFLEQRQRRELRWYDAWYDAEREVSGSVEPMEWDEACGLWSRRIVKADPGGGKTWLLRYAAGELASQELAALEGDQLALDDVELPVFARLPKLAERFGAAAQHDEAALRRVLLRAAHALLEDDDLPSGVRLSAPSKRFLDWTSERLRGRPSRIFWDGWDEVLGQERIAGKLRALVRSCKKAQVTLSSRFLGYGDGPGFTLHGEKEPQGFKEIELLPFGKDEVKGFAQEWFGADGGERFVERLTGDLDKLSRTPLMVTFLCRIASDQAKRGQPEEPLPALRSEVLRLALRYFIEDARTRRSEGAEGVAALPALDEAELDERLRALARVSLDLFLEGDPDPEFRTDEEFAGTTFVDLLAPYYAEQRFSAGTGSRGVTDFDRSRARGVLADFKITGLLTETAHDPPRYRLVHRAMQEYLAAVALAGFPPDRSSVVEQETARLFQWSKLGHEPATAEHWQNVVSFLPGVHLYGRKLDRSEQDAVEPERVIGYARTLLGHAGGEGRPHPREGHLFGLAARALVEARSAFPKHPGLQAYAKQVANLLVEAFEARHETGDWQRHWKLDDRIFALEQLGYLGDPRLSPEKLWVHIPGGTFTMGTNDPVVYVSSPPHRVRLSPFHIAWHPVTVGEFAEFAQHGYPRKDGDQGYLRYWSARPVDTERDEKGDLEFPDEWERQLEGSPNVPVANVTWYAARAYCRWLKETRRCACGEQHLDDDFWGVSLPTEAEWEYVAREGSREWMYPWGNDPPDDGDAARANYRFRGSPPRRLTPVGAFPLGNANRGSRVLADLGGNAWEWCLDAWRDGAAWRPVGTRVGCVYNPIHRVDTTDANLEPVRVARGGSFSEPADLLLRAEFRDGDHPGSRRGNRGFRPVCRCPREHGH